VKFFLFGLLFAAPGGVIIFLLLLTGFRLLHELISPSFLFFDILASLLLYLGMALMVLSVRSFKQIQRWETEGKITNGAIQDVWVERHHYRWVNFERYFVKFSFQVMGNALSMQQEISKKVYIHFFKGQTVSIKYLPAKPHIARIVKYLSLE